MASNNSLLGRILSVFENPNPIGEEHSLMNSHHPEHEKDHHPQQLQHVPIESDMDYSSLEFIMEEHQEYTDYSGSVLDLDLPFPFEMDHMDWESFVYPIETEDIKYSPFVMGRFD